MSSRIETLLKYLSDDGVTIPKPQSRLEGLLYKYLGYNVNTLEPQSRVEMLLEEVLKVLSGGGTTEYQVVIPETTVELIKADGTPLPDGWAMCNAPATLAETPNLVGGQTYKLTINGTTYDMKVTYHETTGTYLGGNTSLLMDGTDNGEDYIFQLGEFQGSPTLMLFLKGEAGTHTVKLGFNQSEIDEIETLIDNSGVLDNTEGTATEKVKQLIDKAEELDVFQSVTAIAFNKTTFPSKERVKINLPNVTSLAQRFSYWNEEPIPIVEELNITAPLVTDISRMFLYNNAMKKVVLNLSEKCVNMLGAFNASTVTEVVLNFSTKNVTTFDSAFSYASKLEKIVGALDLSSATNVSAMFNQCYFLRDVEFKPNTIFISIAFNKCNSLSAESVQSIIDGLATVETAQTLTLSSTTFDNLTDEQLATIAAKNWLVA